MRKGIGGSVGRVDICEQDIAGELGIHYASWAPICAYLIISRLKIAIIQGGIVY